MQTNTIFVLKYIVNASKWNRKKIDKTDPDKKKTDLMKISI